ncbi:hypothetical protein C8R46DRAFT_955323 [Mycena filopes]|nr:hypothetical protein C8R46DRAFT_955323 [Mycena filopes]
MSSIMLLAYDMCSLSSRPHRLLSQGCRRNKDECFQMVESIHQILYSIIQLHLKFEDLGTRPLVVIEAIGEFTTTLHKIYMFIEIQQDGNKIKQFFRQSEANKLLKECQAGLDQAIGMFNAQTRATVFSDVKQVQTEADNMHKELLELISALSDTDGTMSDRSLLVLYGISNGSQKSSTSFSLLPSNPKIFHGRESELQQIVEALAQGAPRIAILGGGGMGKTSLARATLHHSDTCSKFRGRFFVSAEAATTAIELAALICLHLDMESGPDPIRPVVRYFAQQTSPCLLVLDNLETLWEPLESRSAVEEFISLLADVTHLALIITMRGAERPGKVQWTRPFLQPLEPLPDAAALQIFEDITDNPQLSDEKTQLLQFTGNIPLALDLMAHLVEYEGLTNVLARWETERTSLLSIGYDRSSNMDASIALSLSSPRITPQSRELLSLLSILPDGLSDVELVESPLPIKDILSCKSVLIATSLAYKDNKGRLRSLALIREHVQHFSPPTEALVQSLRNLFHDLLALCQKYNDSRLSGVLAQITANLANIDQVLYWGLRPKSLDLAETIQSTISLNFFYRITRDGSTHLLNKIPIHLCGPRQRVLHIIECLLGLPGRTQTQKLLAEGTSQFQHFQDPLLEGRLLFAAARSCKGSGLSQELQLCKKALALFRSTGDDGIQSYCLSDIAWFEWRRGDYTAALALGKQAKQCAYQATHFLAASNALDVCTASLTSLGDYPQAMMEIHKGIELLILCGMASSELHYGLLNSQAEIHLCKSEYPEARKIHAVNLQDSGLDPSSDRYVITLLNMAQIDLIIGTRKELVCKTLQTAYKTCISTHYLRGQTWCDLFSACLDLREGNPASARAMFQDSLKSNLGHDSGVIIYCLEQLANVTQWPTKFLYEHSRWSVLYLCQAHKTKDRLGLSKALLFFADLFMDDDEVTTRSLLTVALEAFTFMDVHCSRGQCMMRLGDLAQKNGMTIEAADLWKSAQYLFERSLQAKDVARIGDRLSVADHSNSRVDNTSERSQV